MGFNKRIMQKATQQLTVFEHVIIQKLNKQISETFL